MTTLNLQITFKEIGYVYNDAYRNLKGQFEPLTQIVFNRVMIFPACAEASAGR